MSQTVSLPSSAFAEGRQTKKMEAFFKNDKNENKTKRSGVVVFSSALGVTLHWISSFVSFPN